MKNPKPPAPASDAAAREIVQYSDREAIVMTEPQKGAAAVFLSYIWWGSMPLYWKLLGNVPSAEILGHRVVWSAAFMAAVLFAARGWRAAFSFVRREPRASLWLAGGGFLITFNWWLYIWAVNLGQVLETSLGYYMNPLLSMLFGRFFFGERMRGAQKAALALAASGVAVQVAAHGSVPAAGVGLALSFALYGVLKKKIPADPSVSLSIETFAVAPFALAWLVWLEHTGASAYPYGLRTGLLLAGAGVMTSSPLLLFAYGTRRVRLVTIGFIQYVSPTMTFILGTFLYREPMSWHRLAAFGLVWCAIALYLADAAFAARGGRAAAEGRNGAVTCARTNFYKK